MLHDRASLAVSGPGRHDATRSTLQEAAGIMRTFRVYKPAVENANFLEIEHYGTGFISQLRLR